MKNIYFILIVIIGVVTFIYIERDIIIKRTPWLEDCFFDSNEIDSTVTSDSKLDSIKYANSVNRKNLRKYIAENKKKVRFYTISSQYGSVIGIGDNGFSFESDITEFHNILKGLNKKRVLIHDIHICENGDYIVLYGNNDFYGKCSQEIKDRLRAMSSDERALYVSFNSKGTYAIVKETSIYSVDDSYAQLQPNGEYKEVSVYKKHRDLICSSKKYTFFYEEKKEYMGEFYSAYLYEDGIILCFEKGTTFCGKIPKNLLERIDLLKKPPMLVKYDKSGSFIIEREKLQDYNLPDIDKRYFADMVENKYSEQNKSSTELKESKDAHINNSKSVTVVTPAYVPTAHPIKCGVCHGGGLCSECGGSGVSYFGHAHVCGACGGNGRCSTCSGSGISGTSYY